MMNVVINNVKRYAFKFLHSDNFCSIELRNLKVIFKMISVVIIIVKR